MYDGAKFTQVGDVADSSVLRSFQMNFLVLPTGEILGVETDHPNMEIFPAVCCSAKSWAPTIASFPSAITDGTTYTISGTQFNGFTYGASYGDDVQASTNYPLVRVTNTATKAVSYCATFNFSTMGVATGNAKVSTQFSCDAPEGASTLEVVANGIASAPVKVVIALRLTTLYSFCSQGGTNCTDGSNPEGDLVMDASGNLYGVTEDDGTNCDRSTNSGCGGTVFELPFNAATGKYDSAVKTLYTFCPSSDGPPDCPDGDYPASGVIMDASGNLYGTTDLGGTNYDAGTVFELPFDSGTKKYASAVKTLYTFCPTGKSSADCPDGANPRAALIMDLSGNLFGTTALGGAQSAGTVFELPFDVAAKRYASAVKILYNFCSQGGDDCTDGSTPEASLIVDPSGNLYGTTVYGGKYYGTVFELPYDPATKAYSSAIKTLSSFCSNGKSGCAGVPEAGVIMDALGNLYGTTAEGGLHYGGTVYEIPYDASAKKYDAAQTLYSFCSQGGNSCTDGDDPIGGLIIDQSENLYGTTYGGGSASRGTVFELPFNSEAQKYASAVTTLHNFCSEGGSSCSDGGEPQTRLILDGLSGTLYGTTAEGGGSENGGTLFEITP